jgi:hypothetical protein
MSNRTPLYVMVMLVVSPLALYNVEFSIMVSVIVGVMIIAMTTLSGSRFPVNTIIFYKRRNGFSIGFDRAKRVIEKGTNRMYYKLSKSKAIIKPADFGKIIESKAGLYSVLYAPTADEYAPITIDSKVGEIDFCPDCRAKLTERKALIPTTLVEGELKVLNEDMKFWFANTFARLYERFQTKKSWIEKYMTLMAIPILSITIAIILYAAAGYLGNVAIQLQNVADTLASVSS